MPPLTNLAGALAASPDQSAAFATNQERARQVAAAVPLLHVTGRAVPFPSLFDGEPPLLPTSADPAYCTVDTRRTEDLCGFPPSLYFYAGRACPDFGEMALAFLPDCEAGHTGSATPFDTGGVLHPKRYVRLRLDPDSDGARAAFIRAATVPLERWRSEFATFLAAFFDPLTAYWDAAEPTFPDGDGLFRSGNHWRAWAFEVRLHEAEPVLNRHAWCASSKEMNALRHQQQRQPPLPPGHLTPLDVFLATGECLAPAGTPEYCMDMEVWAKARCGL